MKNSIQSGGKKASKFLREKSEKRLPERSQKGCFLWGRAMGYSLVSIAERDNGGKEAAGDGYGSRALFLPGQGSSRVLHLPVEGEGSRVETKRGRV